MQQPTETMQPPSMFREQDRAHLRTLSTCNFVFAGLCLLGLLALGAQLFLMNAIWDRSRELRLESVSQVEEARSSRWGELAEAPARRPAEADRFFESFKSIFAVFLVGMMVVGLAGAVLSFVNGLKLRQQRHRGFSLVVGALQCISVPLGTILGIFTLIVLTRESVRRGYTGAAAEFVVRS